ncbi:hypothetical protein IOD13_00810 [Brevibacterium casei]|nr:hypothetical protein [Brevibacterium casei]
MVDVGGTGAIRWGAVLVDVFDVGEEAGDPGRGAVRLGEKADDVGERAHGLGEEGRHAEDADERPYAQLAVDEARPGDDEDDREDDGHDKRAEAGQASGALTGGDTRLGGGIRGGAVAFGGPPFAAEGLDDARPLMRSAAERPACATASSWALAFAETDRPGGETMAKPIGTAMRTTRPVTGSATRRKTAP